jgi:hypothetical protein
MPEPPSVKEIADFWFMMFKVNWVERRALINWADSVLEAQDDPDVAIIDLSLSSRQPIYMVYDHLREVRGPSNLMTSARLFFAYAGIRYETGMEAPETILNTLRWHFDPVVGSVFDDALPSNVMNDIQHCLYPVSLIAYLEQESIPQAKSQKDQERSTALIWRLLGKSRRRNPSPSVEALQNELNDAKCELDRKLRDILNWGRDYRDLLPPQCFSSHEHEND